VNNIPVKSTAVRWIGQDNPVHWMEHKKNGSLFAVVEVEAAAGERNRGFELVLH